MPEFKLFFTPKTTTADNNPGSQPDNSGISKNNLPAYYFQATTPTYFDNLYTQEKLAAKKQKLTPHPTLPEWGRPQVSADSRQSNIQFNATETAYKNNITKKRIVKNFNIIKQLELINPELMNSGITGITVEFFNSINNIYGAYSSEYKLKIHQLSSNIGGDSQIVKCIKFMHKHGFNHVDISNILAGTGANVDQALILVTDKNLYQCISNKANPYGILTLKLANYGINFLINKPDRDQDFYINHLINLQNQVSNIVTEFTKINSSTDTVKKEVVLLATQSLNSLLSELQNINTVSLMGNILSNHITLSQQLAEIHAKLTDHVSNTTNTPTLHKNNIKTNFNNLNSAQPTETLHKSGKDLNSIDNLGANLIEFAETL